MSYPALKGLTRLANITLADFGAACGNGAYNYVWMTSPYYGDIFHPMETSEMTLQNVLDRSKVCLMTNLPVCCIFHGCKSNLCLK